MQDIVATLRAERGLSFDPTSKLSDPFLFPEMKKAVERITKAIHTKETVAIFGDYDADGITAAAQMTRFFRRHKVEPVVHLPDRVKEGYGMKKASIDGLKAKGVSLIITVDTGIAAHAEIAHATGLGMDVIITDHHRVQGGRPDAFAVIHPQIPAEFPNQHLSGSAVAFMLIRALENLQPWPGIDIDISLATIGTIADVMPLTGENRTLVIHGLRFMSSLAPSPLKDLIDSVKNGASLTAGDVAFRIAPRLNAAGRMSHPDIALQALLVGGEYLEELHRLNGDRRTFVDLLDEGNADAISHQDGFILVQSPDITPGTAGLLASRLTERYGKPSLVAAVLGENAVASIRSPAGIDVMECLEDADVRSLLLTFGGHAQAAGCTFKAADGTKLKDALNRALEKRGILASDLLPSLHIDAEISESQMNMRVAKDLLSLAPFGAGNTEPLFQLSKQKLSDLRTVGAEGAHVQFRIGQIRGIGFRFGKFLDELSTSELDLACRIGINEWNGRESLQIVVEDMRKSHP
jgi:single-stranded-DNA-specific exonuclease